MRFPRKLVLIAAALGAVVSAAAPASAHVSVTPSQANQGGDATLSFEVPDEQDHASTIQVDLALPTDHPIASVRVKPVQGWTASVQRTRLAKPISSDDGDVAEVVSQVTWTAASPGAGIQPGEFLDFELAAGPLPTDTSSLPFKVLQTYSDGTVVRWIELPIPDGGEPAHPAPTLTLVPAPAEDHSTGSGPTTTARGAATSNAQGAIAAVTSQGSSRDRTARVLGVAGLTLGALGLIAAAAGFRRGRPRGPDGPAAG